MLMLKHWFLEETGEGRIYAVGYIFGHYRIEDGCAVHTNYIDRIYGQKKDTHVVQTFSGHLYRLALCDMDQGKKTLTMKILEKSHILDGRGIQEKLNAQEEAFRKRKTGRQELLARALELAEQEMDQDGLYFLMDRRELYKIVLKRNGTFREEEPYVHVGMFQDSVLIHDSENEKVEFRYFPKTSCCEPYDWSSELAALYIHNIGSKDISWQIGGREVICKGGEVTRIERKAYWENRE